MPLPQVAGYHALIRKTSRTERALAKVRQELPPICLFEDDDLALVRLGGSLEIVNQWVENFEGDGMQIGTDFAVSNGRAGMFGPSPTWLRVELAESGNPAELEAAMEPQVRELWDRSRVLWYSVRETS